LHLTAASAALSVIPRIARAQAYPTRPVRLIVGFAAGAGADTTARLICQWLSERLGQSFIVENRPGAGTNLATEAVVKAASDGHTLLLVSPANTISAFLYDKLSFNFVRDITPVASILRQPNVLLAHPTFPAKTISDLVTLAKARPGQITMASPGNGSSPHISGELFKMMTDVNMIHVPYRGGAPAMADLLSGQVQISFVTLPGAIEYMRAGKLLGLAITSTTRSHVLPDIPTVGETVPGFEASSFYGIGAPKNTPSEVVERLNREINAGLADPKIKTRLADLGATAFVGSPTDFGRHVAEETQKWAKVVKFAGIKPE
jgi:tripartite-type tricarboxylate transporter receptor subunit TctC